MNRKNYTVKIALQFALLLFLFVVSCSKDNDPAPIPEPPKPSGPSVPKATGRDLLSVNILKADNPALATDAYVYKPTGGNIYYMTIPLGVSDRNLQLELVTSEKSKITVNGTEVASSAGKFEGNPAEIAKAKMTINETDRIAIQVTSEAGFRDYYEIIVQDGIATIDAMVYPFILKYNIPAASYAIGKNSAEEVVYKNALGYVNVDKKERARPDHLFRLASMSKQFTAIGIMSLIQQGKIGIDDLVFGPTGILKDQWPSVGAKSSQVTVRHLLEHTAGYSGDPMFSSATPNTLDRRIDIMLASTQETPGTKYIYYNMGYGTLGKIIEKVSGKDYITYIRELLAPTGATDVYLAAKDASSLRSNEATLYPQGGNAYGTPIEVYKAAGGILTNTDNLFKMLYAVDGGTKKPDILNSDIRQLMFTPSAVYNRYAKGWRANHDLFAGYYHGGNLRGTATFWIYGTEYSVAVLLNSRSYDAKFDEDLIVLTKNIMEAAKRLNL